MSLYNGWTIYTMPSSPAPKDTRPKFVTHAAVSRSPFTNKQQTQDWGGRHMEFSVSMPPIGSLTLAHSWVNFLMSLQGPLGVFQFSTMWNTVVTWTYPGGYSPTGYWRLKAGQTEWSVSDALLYGLTFEIEEAS